MFYVPKKPFHLYQLAEKNGIVIEFFDFNHPRIEAVYIEQPGFPPAIGMSKSLFAEGPHFQTLLAHEMGHFFTKPKGIILTSHCHYKDRIETGRDEYRASAWAATYLMPTHELEQALLNGIRRSWELAEYFFVDQELVKLRLILYFERERKGA